mmetsp:Transcript_18039/g.24762  ORF Transcript_18039/g.24762 Transcript_18039/m.24762 type:complete len:238 (-) Transcript_18039:983-1696(-)
MVNEVVCVGLLGGLDDSRSQLFLRLRNLCCRMISRIVHHRQFRCKGHIQTISNIVSNRAGKQNGFLTHITNLSAQEAHIQVFDIVTIQLHTATVRVVEAEEQIDDGGLTAARSTNQSTGLARLNGEVVSFAHLNVRSRGIGEHHVGQLYQSYRSLLKYLSFIRESINQRLAGDSFQELLGGHSCSGDGCHRRRYLAQPKSSDQAREEGCVHLTSSLFSWIISVAIGDSVSDLLRSIP